MSNALTDLATIPPMTTKRPVFSEAAGAAFTRLRIDAPNNLRGALSSLRKAAKEAERLGLTALTLNALWRAENGKIKRPTPAFVRDLSALYGYDHGAFMTELTRIYFGVSSPDTQTADDRKNRKRTRTNVVASASNNTPSGHVSQSPSVSSAERQHALEAGLRHILAIAVDLIGQAAGAGRHDRAATPSGNRRTGTDPHGASARDKRPRPRVPGARR